MVKKPKEQTKPEKEVVIDSVIDSLLSNEEEESASLSIVNELLSTKNIETKTDLERPITFSALAVFRDWVKSRDLPFTVSILDKFMETSFKFLVSKNRQGRKELIEALKTVLQHERDEIGQAAGIQNELR